MPHARSELRAALAGGVRLWIQPDPPVLLLIAKQDARVALEVAPMSDPCPATFAPAAHDPGTPDRDRLLRAPDSRISIRAGSPLPSGMGRDRRS